MDLNKLAELVYNASFQDELRKIAQAKSDPSELLQEYGPAALALGLSVPAMNAGSRVGREVATSAVPVMDWLMAKARPEQGLDKYIKGMVGNRYASTHAGTFGGAAAGLLGTLALYNYLTKKDNPLG